MYLQVSDLKKSYGDGSSYAQVLRGISTSVEKGNICLILGPSGSGKSTLLNCIGGLETSDSGSIIVDGQEITKLKKKTLAKYRRDNLGFIFLVCVAIYALIHFFLVGRLGKIEPNEVLKNRE